jgi:hypothetical protein
MPGRGQRPRPSDVFRLTVPRLCRTFRGYFSLGETVMRYRLAALGLFAVLTVLPFSRGAQCVYRPDAH